MAPAEHGGVAGSRLEADQQRYHQKVTSGVSLTTKLTGFLLVKIAIVYPDQSMNPVSLLRFRY
jgi:hypothetical protein